jgi:RND family efflux transporter MFP subunit
MKYMMNRTILLSLSLLAIACSDHDHEGEHDHGHAHDEHGGHGGSEYPAESVTLWTDKAELFMEWDALTVGRESRFLAHISDMSNPELFKAVAAGTVTVTLSVEGKGASAWQVEEPARLGIFIPTVVPKVAGPCKLTIALASESLTETFNIEPCVVHPDEASAKKAATDEEEAGDEIGFLKEQQWPIAFATAEARVQDLTPSATINAKIKAVAGHEAKLTASTAGRLVLASPAPTLGSQIKKGQVLARIQPTMSAAGNLGALQADVTAAQAEFTAAQAAKERLERLVATDAVPKRRLDEAVSALEVARARLQAARTLLSSYRASAGGSSRATAGAFRITSPIDGTLVEQNVTEGETVSAGALLFSVIDLDRVWVEGRVFEPDVPKFEDAENAWFTVDGRNTVFEIGGDTGRLVTLGHVLDSKSRTVPVVYEVQNPGRKIRIGQFAKLSVATGPPSKTLVIPEQALIQDGNQAIVFVHVSGEAFERRVVSLGARSRGLVEIKGGVQAGERVVTVGAYDVKLAASAGGAPAHGHAH